MAQVKMNMKKPVPQQIQRGREVYGNMNGNVVFASVQAVVTELNTATNNLETAYNDSRTRDKEKMAQMRAARVVFYGIFVQLAAAVQSISGGDETIILQSGMEVRNRRSVPQVPQPPALIQAKVMKEQGVIVVRCKRVSNAKTYLFEVCDDPATEEGFKEAGFATKAKLKLEGLGSIKKYWLRVCAINDAGNSGWSEYAYAVTH